MPQLGNFIRGGGVVTARAGRGEGSTIVALRLERLPEKPKRLADDIAALDGIAAVQIGATDIARTSVPTVEKGMRKDEGVFAGLLLIEALDAGIASQRGAPGGRNGAGCAWRCRRSRDISGHLRAR